MGLLLEVLGTVDFLTDVPAEVLERFMVLGRSTTCPRDHVFWRAGQSAEGIVIPVSGVAAAARTEPDGRVLCYAFFGTGECVGAHCVIDGLPHPTEVRAIRAGEFFVMERATFARFLDAHPAVRARVLAMTGREFRRSLEERDRVVFLSVHARLARFLLERACIRRSDGARVLLRLTHSELAFRLGSVREVVARAMADFAARGLVSATRHGLTIVDWSGLSAEAGCPDGETPECSCGSEASAARTRRYFLAALDGGSGAVGEEARECAGLSLSSPPCTAFDCPLAVTLHRELHLARTEAAARAPRACACAVDGSADGVGAEARRSPRRSLAEPSGHAIRGRNGEDGVVRSPHDERVIRRRVELYRQRVATIESQFGAETRVPATVSVFQESAGASN